VKAEKKTGRSLTNKESRSSAGKHKKAQELITKLAVDCLPPGKKRSNSSSQAMPTRCYFRSARADAKRAEGTPGWEMVSKTRVEKVEKRRDSPIEGREEKARAIKWGTKKSQTLWRGGARCLSLRDASRLKMPYQIRPQKRGWKLIGKDR